MIHKIPVLIGSLKVIGVQNQLPISFGATSVCNKISKVRNSLLHTQVTNLEYLITN